MDAPMLALGGVEPFAVREGGMAYVYLCRGEELGHEYVAVKRLKPGFVDNPDVSRRFLRECYIWTQLGNHPNVVEAYFVGTALGEPPWVILEFVEISLRERLRQEPMDLPAILRIIADTAAGMTHAAKRIPGFVHRDIKPENIMLTAAGRAKVTDFGLAHAAGQEWDHRPPGEGEAAAAERPVAAEASFLTGGAALLGTPMYMAPEQVLGDRVSVATDIYATGCILFEMLAGRPVFGKAKGAGDAMRLHAEQTAPDVREFRQDIPGEIAAMVGRCLRKQPEERYQDFEVLRAETARLLKIQTGTVLPAAPEVVIDAERLYNSCQGLIGLGYFEDARKQCEAILQMGVDNRRKALALLAMARIHAECNRLDEAQGAVLAAGQLLDDVRDRMASVGYHFEAGNLANLLGKPAEAVQHAERSVQLAPEASMAWYNLAAAYRAVGQREKAIEAARQAVRISPDVRYLIPLADLLAERSDDLPEALRVLGRATEIHGDNADVLETYARVAMLRAQALLREEGALTEAVRRYMEVAFKALGRVRDLGRALSPEVEESMAAWERDKARLRSEENESQHGQLEG